MAGSGGREIFAEDCYPLILRYTGGVPRLINTLCETSMMVAFARDMDTVSVDDIQTAVDELRWKDFSERVRGIGEVDPADTSRLRKLQGPSLSVSSTDDDERANAKPVPLGKLVVVADGKTVGELPLLLGRTIIGRTPDNDLQIDSRFVSRHHCQVVTQAQSSVIEDLNSTNGIVIKSRRVRRHNLNDGDVITIGRHDLIYLDQRGERAGTTGNHSVAALETTMDDMSAVHGATHVTTNAQDSIPADDAGATGPHSLTQRV